jgi:hypothetical protein
MPPTAPLSALVGLAEAGRILTAELKHDWLAVKLAYPCQLVLRTLTGDRVDQEGHCFERPDCPRTCASVSLVS